MRAAGYDSGVMLVWELSAEEIFSLNLAVCNRILKKPA